MRCTAHSLIILIANSFNLTKNEIISLIIRLVNGEQNSLPPQSQKENIMQVTSFNKKPVVELISEIYEPPLSQKSDKVKVQEANILNLKKPKSLKLMLEAYGDCV